MFLTIGPSVFDVKAYSPQPFQAGIDSIGEVYLSAGGVSRNIAENLARFGAQTTLLSVVGDDTAGKIMLDATARAGVDVSRVRVVEGQKSAMFATMAAAGQSEPYIVYNGEAQQHLTADYLLAHRDVLRQTRCCIAYTDPETRAAFCAVRDQINPQALIGLCVKPAEATPDLLDVFAQAHWMVLNRIEAGLISGTTIDTAQDAATALRRIPRKDGQIVIITLGDAGCMIAGDQGIQHVPSCPPARIVDVVGAGDAFTAGFAYQLLQTGDALKAAAWGAAAASLTVESSETVWSSITAAAVPLTP
jgi:pseudouridine kinase